MRDVHATKANHDSRHSHAAVSPGHFSDDPDSPATKLLKITDWRAAHVFFSSALQRYGVRKLKDYLQVEPWLEHLPIRGKPKGSGASESYRP